VRGLALALVILAACASNAAHEDTERYGTVENVRTVRLADDRRAESVFAGAALGSVLGEAIGGGVATTLLGAVSGGVAGHELANATGHEGQEIVIHLDGGGVITVVQPGIDDFAPGQRVRVRGRMLFHQ
jgi:outer membrane lipoprotein SlyB